MVETVFERVGTLEKNMSERAPGSTLSISPKEKKRLPPQLSVSLNNYLVVLSLFL